MGSDEMPAWSCAEALLTNHHQVSLLRVHHASTFDHRWLSKTVSQFQSFLLRSYEWVLFAEVDEFVLPMPGACPAGQTLLDYVRGLGENPPPAVRATGFEVIQQDDEVPVPGIVYESGSNFSLTAGDLIGSRDWGYYSRMYSKTLLASVPLNWTFGFHSVEGTALEVAQASPSSTLALVHLHRADFALALGRSRRSAARKWSQFDVERRYGWQNRIDNSSELRAFWSRDLDTNGPLEAGRLVPIAPHLKAALR